MLRPPPELAPLAAEVLARLRACRPRVHCITNSVAQNFTANMLLAAGARPSMTISPEEVADFTARSDALLVNLGTFDAVRRQAADIAVAAAIDTKRPWVLDPVLIEQSPVRAAYARALAARSPAALRLNGAEFAALADAEPGAEAIRRYARATDTVVGLTGETDLVADGTRLVAISNGDPLMQRVTAMGCASSALVAACLAVESDPWLATAAALLALGVAGEVAAAGAEGPGSFAVRLIDALDRLDAADLIARARVGT